MAVTILLPGDRIPVKIGEVTFKLSPLTEAQEINISACSKIVNGENVVDHAEATRLALKYTIKGIEGIVRVDGTPFELEFEENADELTSECIRNILRVCKRDDLITSAWTIINGLPVDSVIRNPITGDALEGVNIELPKPPKKRGNL